MKILRITTIICLFLLATNINANTLFFDTDINIFGVGDTLTPPAEPGTLFGLGGPDLGALPQFDPSTGTLVSATLTITGDLEYDLFAEGGSVIDNSSPNEILAAIEFGIGGVVPIGSTFFLTPLATGIDTAECFAGPFEGSCSGGSSGGLFADTNDTFTGSDLAAFIGTSVT